MAVRTQPSGQIDGQPEYLHLENRVEATIMTFTQAIARRPVKEMAAGITASTLGPPDYQKALDQFAAYVETLRHLGLSVTVRLKFF